MFDLCLNISIGFEFCFCFCFFEKQRSAFELGEMQFANDGHNSKKLI